MTNLELIIQNGNDAIDLAIDRVILKHTYQIKANEMAETLYRKGSSMNSVPISRIHIDAKQNRDVIELLSIANAYMSQI